MNDPIKVYPMATTPYDRQNLPIQARMASALADMGELSTTHKHSAYQVPRHGMAAFISRQRARGERSSERQPD